jgi:hypothetical protein
MAPAPADLHRHQRHPDGPVANNGSFDLPTVPGGPGSEVMYRENGTSDELVEDPAVTARHQERFEKL